MMASQCQHSGDVSYSPMLASCMVLFDEIHGIVERLLAMYSSRVDEAKE